MLRDLGRYGFKVFGRSDVVRKLRLSLVVAQNWQIALIAAAIVLIVALLVAMRLVVESQVQLARDRLSREEAVRAAEARCFALPSRLASEACRLQSATSAKSNMGFQGLRDPSAYTPTSSSTSATAN
jgi:hypothetical protein